MENKIFTKQIQSSFPSINLSIKDKISILFRQIAGAVARRIMTYSKKNDNVNVADEFGFIKFGSRVDLFFPIGTKISTQLEEKVTGGQSVIASY
mgnify:CR=1 FL=1